MMFQAEAESAEQHDQRADALVEDVVDQQRPDHRRDDHDDAEDSIAAAQARPERRRARDGLGVREAAEAVSSMPTSCRAGPAVATKGGEEQGEHADILVGGAEIEGRQRLDDADAQARQQRARHAAEAAEADDDEGDQRQPLADRRRDVEEQRDQRAGDPGAGRPDAPGERLGGSGRMPTSIAAVRFSATARSRLPNIVRVSSRCRPTVIASAATPASRRGAAMRRPPS